MALYIRTSTCEAISPFMQFKRFRGKINVQKPKPPHFRKAKCLALTKPWFLPKNKSKPALVDLCSKSEIPSYKKMREENIFQQIIAQEVNQWFKTSKFIAFCHLNHMTKDQEFKAYAMFKKEKMFFKQYGKKTIEMAVMGTAFETVLDFYISRNVTVFSLEPEIAKVLKILKKFPQLVLLAGIYENRLLSKDELVYYSQIPNLQAAQAGLVHTLNTAGLQLVSNLNSHQSVLVSHLAERAKQLEDE